MANNKDFIVKSAVEVGGAIKETLGTVTGTDLDLSTGNYFKLTDAGDSVITFSNPPQNQSFQLELTYGKNTYQVTSAPEKLDETTTINSYDNAQYGMFIRSNGLQVFTHGAQYDKLYRWSLGTAWDFDTFTTSGYTSSSDVNHASGGIFFKPDGTTVFLADNNSIREYSLSTAWNVASTVTLQYTLTTVAGTNRYPVSIKFKPDGTKMFFTTDEGGQPHEFQQYSLSTAWDLSTATLDYDKDVETWTDRRIVFDFAPDGKRLLMLNNDGWQARQYTLSTAWDISDFDVSNYDVEADMSHSGSYVPAAAQWNNDGSQFIVLETYSGSTRILWYNSSAPSTITWPSSVQWAGGEAPSGLPDQSVRKFTFITTDGGTTYTGYVTSENYS